MFYITYNLCSIEKNEKSGRRRVKISPAVTMYVNEKDKAKIKKLAEKNGITMTKLCRNIIAEWVRVRMGHEEGD